MQGTQSYFSNSHYETDFDVSSAFVTGNIKIGFLKATYFPTQELEVGGGGGRRSIEWGGFFFFFDFSSAFATANIKSVFFKPTNFPTQQLAVRRFAPHL
ncbi:MAG: hypothetical protein ACK5RE_19950 [Pseudanabaena sp.]